VPGGGGGGGGRARGAAAPGPAGLHAARACARPRAVKLGDRLQEGGELKAAT
jgi:hypothetical protein